MEQRSTWEAGVLGMDSEKRVERVVWGGLREGCLWEGLTVGGRRCLGDVVRRVGKRWGLVLGEEGGEEVARRSPPWRHWVKRSGGAIFVGTEGGSGA